MISLLLEDSKSHGLTMAEKPLHVNHLKFDFVLSSGRVEVAGPVLIEDGPHDHALDQIRAMSGDQC